MTRFLPEQVEALRELQPVSCDLGVATVLIGAAACRLNAYEQDADRRFSDRVFDAGVNYTESGAWLLGRDLARLCTDEGERDAVRRFVALAAPTDESTVSLGDTLFNDPQMAMARRFAVQAAAFARGWADA